ncbi:hypothetical protein RESH_05254 [Rhodopirellula europaea SH398]|uniref:Uncharacterized protein n=1 Tax=Rhodopirellula europaea SH398 TaxID=1263868 RepID=M5RXQ0_9BACT|nr:hypothetical protein RESH_05254 [Rhodopirellula europaea SH398]
MSFRPCQQTAFIYPVPFRCDCPAESKLTSTEVPSDGRTLCKLCKYLKACCVSAGCMTGIATPAPMIRISPHQHCRIAKRFKKKPATTESNRGGRAN